MIRVESGPEKVIVKIDEVMALEKPWFGINRKKTHEENSICTKLSTVSKLTGGALYQKTARYHDFLHSSMALRS